MKLEQMNIFGQWEDFPARNTVGRCRPGGMRAGTEDAEEWVTLTVTRGMLRDIRVWAAREMERLGQSVAMCRRPVRLAENAARLRRMARLRDCLYGLPGEDGLVVNPEVDIVSELETAERRHAELTAELEEVNGNLENLRGWLRERAEAPGDGG